MTKTKSTAPKPTPGDQRATVKNPTSKAYAVDKAHTAKQVKGQTSKRK